MTDSEKLDLLLGKAEKIDQKVTKLDRKAVELDRKITKLDERVTSLEKDMAEVKADLKLLHRDDALILDEVERVHAILDLHKADRKAHTA